MPKKPDNYVENDYSNYPDNLQYIGLILNTIASLITTYGVTLEREQAKQEKANQQLENGRGQELQKQMMRMIRETEQMKMKMEHMQQQINRLQ
ncbi:hypothetical protein [Virgibacillus necropolis]|uniref:Uncharacterized protein n=1 Tax=Virgibacillus necropolis TaxID=163877 RepID=A0A221MFG6_9BACI|nr:hypothetical protein [Virgibacillus necropolis]ASN06360.1 hypothetical protein CFK40_15695 [Virgibacillus necropolis]